MCRSSDALANYLDTSHDSFRAAFVPAGWNLRQRLRNIAARRRADLPRLTDEGQSGDRPPPSARRSANLWLAYPDAGSALCAKLTANMSHQQWPDWVSPREPPAAWPSGLVVLAVDEHEPAAVARPHRDGLLTAAAGVLLAGHRPGVGQRDAGDDVAVVVVVVIGPVAYRICLNCSRITPVSVGSSLSVSGILSRPGTT